MFRRADRVVVEDAPTALREAGDVIHAIASGALAASDLIGLAQLAAIPTMPTVAGSGAGISVFKSVGTGWQDLAIAESAVGPTIGGADVGQ